MRVKNDFPNNITANELEKGSRKSKSCSGGKRERTVYAEKDKQEIAKYRAICGVTAALRK